jgi:hypothetical protein
VLSPTALLLFCSSQKVLSPTALLLFCSSQKEEMLLCCCPVYHKTEMLFSTQDHMTYSIILPLSLVRRLVGKLSHPGPRTKLKELDPPKGLGE